VSSLAPSVLVSFVRMSRLPYLGAGIFFLFAVAAVGTGSWARMTAELPWILVGAGLWVFCHLVGSHINCLADVDVDRKFKQDLAASVDRLSPPVVIRLVALETAAATLLAGALCVRTGSAWPLVMFAGGWSIAMAYSLEPVRLKRRGFWSPVALLAVLYLLPVALGYTVLVRRIDWASLTFLGAVALQMFAVISMNALEDIPEDRSTGIQTVFVRHGLRLVATVALVSYGLGASLAIMALLLGMVPVSALAVAVTVAMIGAHLWVVSGLLRVRQAGARGDAPVSFIRREGGRNAQQFAVVGAAFAAAAVLVVVGH
jgi:4-hydroxybenzoate polyprenyltransferase